jgi:A1 cistron-splicing factor AAR2
MLAPYPLEVLEDWQKLTSKINDNVLERIQSVSRIVCSDAMGSDLAQKEHTSSSALPFTLFFVDIPNRSFPKDSPPEIITKYSLDKSYLFETLLKNQFEGRWEEMLGELQFSFLCFFLGQHYGSFEQWKKLLHIFCGCEEAIGHHLDFFVSFIDVTQSILSQLPQDFFIDNLSKDNFLVKIFGTFFETLEDSSYEAETLHRKAADLRVYFEEKFGFIFEGEKEEDLPIVVNSVE